jgi:serine protease
MKKINKKEDKIHFGAQIVIKFHDYLELHNIKNIDDAINEKSIGDWSALKKSFPGISLGRLITSIKDEQLNSLIRKAINQDSTYKPPNFNNYFFIKCPAEVSPEFLLKDLRGWKNIEKVYIDYPVPDPFVNDSDDPRAINQNYLDAAPTGIDARYAWGFNGGDGTGISIIDMERGWTFNHEDLNAHGITLLHGTLLNSSRGHGTSVLGEICALDNTVGCVGIAPNIASINVVSYNGSSRPNAIIAAISNLIFGDVLILEAQVVVPGTTNLLGPCEVLDADFDAIRLATALGIIVVEAGGNGTDNGSTPPFDLDAYTNPSGKKSLFRDDSNPDFLDSGAIIVSASSSSSPYTRMEWAPHGNRIDCYAWGQNINTLSSDSSGATTLYTTLFGGTSGASPIIAGAALVIQGIYQNNFEFRLSPRQMRAILSNPLTGTLPASTETTKFGVLPNLRSIIDTTLNLSPDVYIRDNISDTGEPHTGPVSCSPDIILNKTEVLNPQVVFGAGSGTENDYTLGTYAEIGQDNYIYVRMLNQGGADAVNVKATVYWSPPSTLVTPDLWTKIGSVIVPNVPTGEILTVSNKITWPASMIPGIGHYCFIGIIGNAQDPAPDPADFIEWDNYTRFIRDNNNVTWRNFNVVDSDPDVDPLVPKDFFALPFIVPGAPDKKRIFDFEIISRLPEGSKVFLEIPLRMRLNIITHFIDLKYKLKKGYTIIPLKYTGRQYFEAVELGAKSRAKIRLLVNIPEKYRKGEYTITIRQIWEKQEVGRLSWKIVSKEKKKKLEKRF